jgi:hypothetical protein
MRPSHPLIVMPLAIGGGGSPEISNFMIFAGWLVIVLTIAVFLWLMRRKPPTMDKEQQAKERLHMSGDRPGGGGGGGGAY